MTQKIQYFHNRPYSFNGDLLPKGGQTICAEMPTTKEILSLIHTYLTQDKSKDICILKIGTARCHLEDRYSKKEGAKIAQERLAPMSVRLDQFSLENLAGIINITFIGNNFKIQMRVYLPDLNRNARLIFFEKF